MINLLDECKDAKSIAISGHIRPDGDCIGSCIAVALFLREKMPNCVVDVLLEDPSDIFNTISEIDTIISVDNNKEYEVFIVLDCDYSRLVSFAQSKFNKARKTINIDHHITNKGEATVNYINEEIGSTAEIIFEILGEENINLEIAKSLYIGIIHDTGVMQYSNTRPRTLEIVAKLIAFDFDFPRIIEETFYQKNYKQTQVLGRILVESFRVVEDKLIFGYIDKKTMDFYKARPQTLDGAVNKLKQVKGIECAVLIYELETGIYKISFRSEKIDVSEVASYFGGGGHIKASGVTIEGEISKIIDDITNKITNEMIKLKLIKG